MNLHVIINITYGRFHGPLIVSEMLPLLELYPIVLLNVLPMFGENRLYHDLSI